MTAATATPTFAGIPSSAEVVVIGGGVIGAACSHALAEAGVSTVLVERGEIGGGASGACEGNVLASDKSPGPEFELARRSIELYSGLEERLEADIQLEAKGSLLVAPNDRAAELLSAEAGWMKDEGLAVELLDPAAALETEPALNSRIAAALLVGNDLQVCPMRLVLALANASARLGARVVRDCGVEAVEVADGRVVAVATTRGRVSCGSVVVAAGVATPGLLATIGEELPLRGRRGQILVSAPAPGLIRHKVYDFGYRATVQEQEEEGVQVATVLETTRRGNVLIGASREFRETTEDPDLAVDALLARRALELAPGLGGLRILRSYAGVRPTLPDGLPAIGRVESVEGLLIATGHEGAGIGLAPATAEMITAAITGDRSPVSPEPFRPGRLGGLQSIEGEEPDA